MTPIACSVESHARPERLDESRRGSEESLRHGGGATFIAFGGPQGHGDSLTVAAPIAQSIEQ